MFVNYYYQTLLPIVRYFDHYSLEKVISILFECGTVIKKRTEISVIIYRGLSLLNIMTWNFFWTNEVLSKLLSRLRPRIRSL